MVNISDLAHQGGVSLVMTLSYIGVETTYTTLAPVLASYCEPAFTCNYASEWVSAMRQSQQGNNYD